MGKQLFNFDHDTAALDAKDLFASQTHVELDGDGIPTAWRIFPIGEFELTRGGVTLRARFSAESGELVMSHYEQKGERIPIDCEHFSYHLAKLAGVEESDLTEQLKAEHAAAGFASLAMRADGLWATDVDWVPRARLLMAEKTYRYFSPVVRGLRDGRLRVTSVALSNTPAIDHLDQLVAQAEAEDVSAATAGVSPARRGGRAARTKGGAMEKLLTLLGAILGMDAIALSDDGTPPADLITELTKHQAEVARLRSAESAQDTFLGGVRDALAMSADDGLAIAQGKVLALAEKAEADSTALTAVTERVNVLETAQVEKDKADLIEKGLMSGKFTQAMVDKWAKGQDVAVLTAFLESAPAVVKPGQTVDKTKLPAADDVALSDSDRAVAKVLGITEEEFETQKKSLRGVA